MKNTNRHTTVSVPINGMVMMQKRQWPIATVFVTTLFVVVTSILIINTWREIDKYAGQEKILVRTSLEGVAKQIELEIVNLQQKVQQFGKQEIPLINKILANPKNIKNFHLLLEHAQQDFPNVMAVTITNNEGKPLGSIGSESFTKSCLNDIQSLVSKHRPPKLQLHSNNHCHNYDIFIPINQSVIKRPDTKGSDILAIVFRPNLTLNLSVSTALMQREVYVANRENHSLLDISAHGLRSLLVGNGRRLSTTQLKNVVYAIPINGTDWELIDTTQPSFDDDALQPLFITSGLEWLLVVSICMVMWRVLSKMENSIVRHNQQLIQQASDQSIITDEIERVHKNTIDMIDRMSNAYLELDQYWMIVNLNRKAEEFFGHQREDLVGRNLWDRFPEAVSVFYKLFSKAITLNRDVHFEGYYPPLRKWMDLHGYPKQEGMVVFFNDITVSKVQESALRENAERIQAIFDSANEGIISVNENGIIEIYNYAAGRIFGLSAEEVIGKPLSVILPDSCKDQYKTYLDNYLLNSDKNSVGTTIEVEGVRKNGENFPMELSISETVLDGKRIITGIVQDISQRKAAVQETNAALLAKSDAESASRAKSAFLANMSHEIRTPLTAIIGFGETLLQSDQTMTERLDAVMTIIRSGHHLLNLINDILDISKIEAGRLEVESVITNPYTMVNDVVQIMRPQAMDKGLGFSVNYNFPLPSCITSDFLRLKQILLNLCSNAIKFTSKGHIAINVLSDMDAQLLIFEIVDTGIGLRPLELERIFNVFAQADSSTSRRFGGSGLGLSLSRQLAHLLGGEIIVDSVPGVGSKFTLTVSSGEIDHDHLIYSEEGLSVSQSGDEYILDEKKVKGRILLAEDNIANQRLISLMLKKMGGTVDLAANGEEAVRKALRNDYDLVLMDMQMPIMDGLEAVTLLKKNGYVVPIIALTANAMQEDRDLCYKTGCVEFVSKPVGREALFAVVSKYLEQSFNPIYDDDPIYSTILEEDAGFLDLVERYINELPRYQEKVDTYFKDENWTELRGIIHQIKGTAGSYGYTMITDQAAKVEFQIINKNYAEVTVLIRQLHNLINRAIAGFTSNNEKIHFLKKV